MVSLTRARRHSFAAPTRQRAGAGQWLLIALLLSALVFAPAMVARSVTAPSEPVNFLQEPWAGWAFAGTVLRDSVRAEAASPGEALTLAQRRWTGERARSEATRVELLYLWQTRTFSVPRPGPNSVVRADGALAWLVMGPPDGESAEHPIGLMGFRSGDVLWDADASEPAVTDTRPTAPISPTPSKDAA